MNPEFQYAYCFVRCCQRFWRRVVLFEISSTAGTEVDSDASFAGVRRLLDLLPELQQGEKSMFSPPNENSAKSIFMQSTRTVRFKSLTTPNSSHKAESYRQNSLRSLKVGFTYIRPARAATEFKSTRTLFIRTYRPFTRTQKKWRITKMLVVFHRPSRLSSSASRGIRGLNSHPIVPRGRRRHS